MFSLFYYYFLFAIYYTTIHTIFNSSTYSREFSIFSSDFLNLRKYTSSTVVHVQHTHTISILTPRTTWILPIHKHCAGSIKIFYFSCIYTFLNYSLKRFNHGVLNSTTQTTHNSGIELYNRIEVNNRRKMYFISTK